MGGVIRADKITTRSGSMEECLREVSELFLQIAAGERVLRGVSALSPLDDR